MLALLPALISQETLCLEESLRLVSQVHLVKINLLLFLLMFLFIGAWRFYVYMKLRKKNYATTNTFKYSCFNRIVDMWNSLPHSVRRAPSIEIFKRSVRDILIRSL